MMTENRFQVSVIIPVFNCRDYIAETIESVLEQSVPAFEIIVVDSSTDETNDIIQKYSSHIRYIFQDKQGIGKARNQGIELARGNFFAHLDADDVWEKEKLALQEKAFLNDPDLDIAGTYMESFFSPELPQSIRNTIYCPPDPVPGFSASTIVVKREAFFRVGMYETHWKVGQDLNWFIRARETGLKERMIPEVLVRRRLHKTNTDRLNHQYSGERLQILKALLDRKRQKSKKQGI